MAKGKYHEWLEPDGLLRLEAWARDGLVDRQIADNIGVTEQTLNVWKKKYPSFSESLKKGKEIVDIEVENALHKRAVGFKEKLKKQKLTREGDIVELEEEVYYPPDTGAAAFWLKNRKPAIWRDKQPETPDENEGNSIKNWIKATSGKAEEGLFDEHEDDEE